MLGRHGADDAIRHSDPPSTLYLVIMNEIREMDVKA
jgi:hypothetical protein